MVKKMKKYAQWAAHNTELAIIIVLYYTVAFAQWIPHSFEKNKNKNKHREQALWVHSVAKAAQESPTNIKMFSVNHQLYNEDLFKLFDFLFKFTRIHPQFQRDNKGWINCRKLELFFQAIGHITTLVV